MPDVSLKLKLLQGKSETIKELVADLERTIEVSAPEDMQDIRHAFFANLSKEWTRLPALPDSMSSWQDIGTSVERLESFLVGLHRVVSQPRRSRLSDQLQAWFADWSTQKVDWMPFLEPASDDVLDEIEAFMDSSQTSTIQDSDVRQIWAAWLDFQLRALRNLEKSGGILSEWLVRVGDNLLTILNLDEFVVDEGRAHLEQSKHAIVQLAEGHWWRNFRAGLKITNTHQDNLDWETDHYRRELDTLRAALSRLTPLADGLSSGQGGIVLRTIRLWTEVSEAQIRELASSLSTILEIQSRDDLGCLDYKNRRILDPALTCITQLVDKRPLLPKPKRNETLTEYENEWEYFNTTFDIWLRELAECRELLSKEALRSHRLMVKYNFGQEASDLGKALDELGRRIDASTTLDQIVLVHNSFIQLRSRLLSTLKQTLDEAEAAVFARLLTTASASQSSLNVVDLQTDKDTDHLLRALYSLSEKGLISLEVRIGE